MTRKCWIYSCWRLAVGESRFCAVHGWNPNQVEWLNALSRAGAEVYVWTLADYDEIASILSQRVPRPQEAA